MEKHNPKTDIGWLRKIGWSLWDPIGLNNTMGGWKGQPLEDEYDKYLILAAGMLRNNSSLSGVVDYLFFIESQHIMGFEPAEITPQRREKLMKVVQAISDGILILRESPN